MSLDAPGQKYGVGGIQVGSLPLLVPRDRGKEGRMEQRETLGDCLLSEPRQLGEMCSKSLEDEERAFCLFCFEGLRGHYLPI